MKKIYDMTRNNLLDIQNSIQADIDKLMILKTIYQNLDEDDLKNLCALSSETEKHEYPIGVLSLRKKYPDAELAGEGIEYLEGLLKRWKDISNKALTNTEMPDNINRKYKNGIPEDLPEELKKLLSSEKTLDTHMQYPNLGLNTLPNFDSIIK